MRSKEFPATPLSTLTDMGSFDCAIDSRRESIVPLRMTTGRLDHYNKKKRPTTREYAH